MSETPFSSALLGLVPPSTAEASEYPGAFRRMANLLLNESTLMVGGVPHRFTEIEFYFNGFKHTDTFTHGDEMQHEGGRWYFHRTGGQYRGGTYKGLDIAIGNDKVPAGILIRGTEQLSPAPRLFDGPCLCVDHMLAMTGSASVEELVGKFDRSIDRPASGDSPLYIVHAADRRSQPVLATARVGLTLKRSANKDRVRYVAQEYRFLTEPREIKKGKQHMVVALHRLGKTPQEISALTGAPKASVSKYIAAFEAGKGKAPEGYRDDLSNEQFCELFGACDGWLPAAPGAAPAGPGAGTQGSLF